MSENETKTALIHHPGANGHTKIATVRPGEYVERKNGRRCETVEIIEDVPKEAVGTYTDGILHDLQQSDARIGFRKSARGSDRVYELTDEQIEQIRSYEPEEDTDDEDAAPSDSAESVGVRSEYGSSPEGFEQAKRELPDHLQ